MRRYVSDQEAAFVLLVARRILNHQRAADQDGEVYHDLAPLAPLGCGVRVKMRFESVPSGWRPVVYLKAPQGMYTGEELQTIAEELLSAPVEGWVESLPDGVVAYRAKESAP